MDREGGRQIHSPTVPYRRAVRNGTSLPVAPTMATEIRNAQNLQVNAVAQDVKC